MFTAAVVTVSDKGSQGLREDTSGPLLSKMLKMMAMTLFMNVLFQMIKKQSWIPSSNYLIG